MSAWALHIYEYSDLQLLYTSTLDYGYTAVYFKLCVFCKLNSHFVCHLFVCDLCAFKGTANKRELRE